MMRVIPFLLLPLALAACNTSGDDMAAVDTTPLGPLGPPGQADVVSGVVGFTVLGQDGAVNAVWTNAGGSTWTALAPNGEQITVEEIERGGCCIAFATSNDAVADIAAMRYRLTASGIVVTITDVVRR